MGGMVEKIVGVTVKGNEVGGEVVVWIQAEVRNGFVLRN